MTMQTPVYSGSDSAVGIKREATWGTTPTTGSDPNKTIDGINFFFCKEENIQEAISVDPQTDDMTADREISRIIQNGGMVGGGLRFIPGPETIGYILTALFGTPTTTTLAATSGSAEAVYQHVFSPGLNTRANWPVPYSIESRYSDTRSKLVQGALCRRLALDIPNNGAVTANPEFLAKKILWLASASGATDDRGNTLPAKVTASPTFIDEEPWHFKQLTAYPQIDDVNVEMLQSLSIEPGFVGLEGLFTGGSGTEIGTYRVDNFQISGRSTIHFEDEDFWEDRIRGLYFKFEATLKGDLIQGAYYNQLEMVVYSAKAGNNDVINKVGDLTYDFGWSGRKDPTEGKSCQFTLINTVSSYAT